MASQTDSLSGMILPLGAYFAWKTAFVLLKGLLETFRPQSAEQIYAWINRHLPDGPKPPIYRPLEYFRIVTLTTILLGLISFFSFAYAYVLPVVQNRNLWAAISLITILLFTSGHMFNHIRKVPYVAGNGKGGISYFAGGFSNQFGMETQIVAAICSLWPASL